MIVTSQFIRYLPFLKAQAVQLGLSSLLQSCEDIDYLIEAALDSKCDLPYDAHSPLLRIRIKPYR